MENTKVANKIYTVSDGELVLNLETLSEDDGGGFGVTSPMEPALITEADTLDEAFFMARDAIAALNDARTEREKLARKQAKEELPEAS
ncbi:type II toxin-antitoxin system HicB family antitoxin [Verrucomicrobiales bacterium]|nr:type II toxin-antitoxin system HicB family antitoxin [Verrucomicrobiales bacterium]